MTVTKNPKGVANWIMTETLRWLGADPDRAIRDYPISAEHLGALIRLIDDGTISGAIAKKVYTAMMDGEGAPDAIVRARGLVQVSDTSALEPIVDDVLAKNPDMVASYKAGKERALGALVGQVMKATQGKANPKLVNELVLRKIS